MYLLSNMASFWVSMLDFRKAPKHHQQPPAENRELASRLKAAMLAMPAKNFWINMSWSTQFRTRGRLNRPIWKICSSKWESSPRFGLKIINIWNHHLENALKPRPPPPYKILRMPHPPQSPIKGFWGVEILLENRLFTGSRFFWGDSTTTCPFSSCDISNTAALKTAASWKTYFT